MKMILVFGLVLGSFSAFAQVCCIDNGAAKICVEDSGVAFKLENDSKLYYDLHEPTDMLEYGVDVRKGLDLGNEFICQ